jgi:beta-glucosidase/6-phospho-beta-glucosidase/beta-galactosidase
MINLYHNWKNDTLHLKGENAKKMVKTHFAWSAILPQFDSLYGI